MRRSVAVVGGGIAGLTFAAALDPARFDVTVYEDRPERSTGAALGLWSDARRALAGIGADVGGLVDSHDQPARVTFHTIGGRRLVTLPAPHVAQVRRPDLMTALRAVAPPVVERSITDPSELVADLVVGADGVRSRVRALVELRCAQRRATRWLTLRGLAVNVGDLDGLSSLSREFWGAARLFGDAPVRGGRYWFTAHATSRPSAEATGTPDEPEQLDVMDAVREARTRFADAAPAVRETLAAADETTLATRLWVAPPMRRYARGRYVVVGDAAHGSLPNLARGASDAVIDAVTLARTLEAGRSLTAWQARRVPATQAARLGAATVMGVATRFG